MSQLIVTEKMLDYVALALKDYCNAIFFEGPARGSKTADAVQCFFYAVEDSNVTQHIIAARDLDAIRNNILYSAVGLITTHPNVKLVKDKIGGYFLRWMSSKGIKEVLLVNYTNETAWRKILGGTIGAILIDEINIASKSFVDECQARQLSADKPLMISTTNGDNPNKYIYQELMNYAKVYDKTVTPASTLSSIDSFQKAKGSKPGLFYIFVPMEDNPIMTADKLARAKSKFPVGSYYYITKILGERGVQGDLLFSDYMREDKLIINAYELDDYNRHKREFQSFSIGVDIGATRAHNVFSLIGWERDYKRATVLAIKSFKQCGYDEKSKALYEFLTMCLDQNGLFKVIKERVDGVMVDSAEQNLIADLKPKVYDKFGLSVVGSYKATIKDRVDMDIVCFSSQRLQFHYTCKLGYESFRDAIRSKNDNDIREDLNEEKNDVMDSIEYALTRHMKALMANGD